MEQSLFEITKMDCPSEENLIRLKLGNFSAVKNLQFDLTKRTLTVYHVEELDRIENALVELNLDSKLVSTTPTDELPVQENKKQAQLLWTVLLINFSFFILELTTGFFSKSMGLVADSLDMLADSFVYGLSLLAVGGTITRKKKVALFSGYLQILLALLGFIEVLRRFMGTERLPDFNTMIVISILALIANALCLYVLQRANNKNEAHMKASLIFTSNDIIINLGVILAGVLVHFLQSGLPDLVIGSLVFFLVFRGSLRILQLGR